MRRLNIAMNPEASRCFAGEISMSKAPATFRFILALVWVTGTCAAQDREWHAEPGFRWTSLQVPQNGRATRELKADFSSPPN